MRDESPGVRQMTTAPHTEQHRAHVPAAVRVGDGRGLTAAGAVAVALGAGVAGGAIDVITGVGLRTTFAVFFVLGCALAAYKVHREDLVAAVVIPPLVYVALAVAANIGGRTSAGGSFVKQQVLELFAVLILRAPVLLTATGAAAVIAVLRWTAGRKSG